MFDHIFGEPHRDLEQEEINLRDARRLIAKNKEFLSRNLEPNNRVLVDHGLMATIQNPARKPIPHKLEYIVVNVQDGYAKLRHVDIHEYGTGEQWIGMEYITHVIDKPDLQNSTPRRIHVE